MRKQRPIVSLTPELVREVRRRHRAACTACYARTGMVRSNEIARVLERRTGVPHDAIIAAAHAPVMPASAAVTAPAWRRPAPAGSRAIELHPD